MHSLSQSFSAFVREEHIGRVCVQLAHPDFKYMTGETLTLEGGLGQRP